MSSLLLLGASGYIGGSLLVALKESNPELEITCLVRSASHVDPIRAAGAQRVVLASDNLLDEAERLSSQSDAVINLAGADSLDIVSAVLRGLKKRFDEGKGSATLIHTSGSAIFSDGDPDGKLNPKSKVWNDGLEEDIRAITISQHHGQVDVPVLKAGEDGYVHTYIICPTVIYGPGSGPINKFSAAEKFSTQPALTRGHAFYVGEGSNVTGSIHINDVVSLFILILNKALSAAPTDSPYARYYIADAKVVDFKTLATITGNVLFKKGLISSPEPKSISATELGPLGVILGSSMPTKDVRARALGWSPAHSEADFVEVYTKDLEELLNAQ